MVPNYLALPLYFPQMDTVSSLTEAKSWTAGVEDAMKFTSIRRAVGPDQMAYIFQSLVLPLAIVEWIP